MELSEASLLPTPSFSPDSHLSPSASPTPFAVAASPSSHFALPPFHSPPGPARTNHRPASLSFPPPSPQQPSLAISVSLSATSLPSLVQQPTSTCHFTLSQWGRRYFLTCALKGHDRPQNNAKRIKHGKLPPLPSHKYAQSDAFATAGT